MARKQTKISKRMLFTWFILGSFIFFFAPQKMTNEFQFAFDRIFRWPLGIGRSISLTARTRSLRENVSPRQYSLLQKEYESLQREVANLTALLSEEHKRVETLSGLRSRLPGLQGTKLLPADARATIDGSHSTLTIYFDKDGDYVPSEGQFVLADNSIIGTVTDVSGGVAWVKLFTDPTSRIAVTIAKLDVNRIMQGIGGNLAKIQLLPTKHKVKKDDAVYACKKPGLLAAPMIIARVAKCKTDDENPSVWDITVEPVCDLERLNNVTVIITNPK